MVLALTFASSKGKEGERHIYTITICIWNYIKYKMCNQYILLDTFYMRLLLSDNTGYTRVYVHTCVYVHRSTYIGALSNLLYEEPLGTVSVRVAVAHPPLLLWSIFLGLILSSSPLSDPVASTSQAYAGSRAPRPTLPLHPDCPEKQARPWPGLKPWVWALPWAPTPDSTQPGPSVPWFRTDSSCPPPSLRQHRCGGSRGPGEAVAKRPRSWRAPQGRAALSQGSAWRLGGPHGLPWVQSGGVWVAGTGVRGLRGGLEVSRALRTCGI